MVLCLMLDLTNQNISNETEIQKIHIMALLVIMCVPCIIVSISILLFCIKNYDRACSRCKVYTSRAELLIYIKRRW